VTGIHQASSFSQFISLIPHHEKHSTIFILFFKPKKQQGSQQAQQIKNRYLEDPEKEMKQRRRYEKKRSKEQNPDRNATKSEIWKRLTPTTLNKPGKTGKIKSCRESNEQPCRGCVLSGARELLLLLL